MCPWLGAVLAAVGGRWPGFEPGLLRQTWQHWLARLATTTQAIPGDTDHSSTRTLHDPTLGAFSEAMTTVAASTRSDALLQACGSNPSPSLAAELPCSVSAVPELAHPVSFPAPDIARRLKLG